MPTLIRTLRAVRPYYAQIALMLVCVLVVIGASLVTPAIIQYVIDQGLQRGDATTMAQAGLLIVGVGLVRALFNFGRRYLGEWLINRTGYDFRNALYDKIQHLPIDYHDRAQTGQLMSRCTEDVNALSRYDASQGAVQVDGYDVRAVTQNSLRRQMGLVLQDPFLFSGSVRDNIRYGMLNAPDGAVEDAAKAVGTHEFIPGLNRGYDTLVGEGGAVLSGGQRQLISFARALLADPRILILDEATSSIDTQTERVIQAAYSIYCKGGRRSSSRTGYRPLRGPIRSSSWITGRLSNRAPTRSCSNSVDDITSCIRWRLRSEARWKLKTDGRQRLARGKPYWIPT